MNSSNSQKHQGSLPTARKIRRACENELYRTAKRLNLWIPKEKIAEAEKAYFRKVILNLQWITENHSNRRLLADWWDENVSDEIALLWDVELDKLRTAFRQSFGG